MLEARREKRHATRAAQDAETKQRGLARLAASQPVVVREYGQNSDGAVVRGIGLVSTYPSSMVRRIDLWDLRPRFPDPAAYAQYQEIQAQITELEKKAQEFLVTAWETGPLVPLEHLEERDRAEGAAP